MVAEAQIARSCAEQWDGIGDSDTTHVAFLGETEGGESINQINTVMQCKEEKEIVQQVVLLLR